MVIDGQSVCLSSSKKRRFFTSVELFGGGGGRIAGPGSLLILPQLLVLLAH